jgi:hypothetical protein
VKHKTKATVAKVTPVLEILEVIVNGEPLLSITNKFSDTVVYTATAAEDQTTKADLIAVLKWTITQLSKAA